MRVEERGVEWCVVCGVVGVGVCGVNYLSLVLGVCEWVTVVCWLLGT
jgi:hypothetical protein